MRVKTIDENRIVIYLNNQEICDIFGGYEFIDYDAADCRTKIHGLLAAAIPSAIMPFDCDRVLIEVKPEISGCSISLINSSAAPTTSLSEQIVIFSLFLINPSYK